MDLIRTAQSRYATKAYDANKKIAPELFERLLDALRLTPSSVNIQPWHFIIASQDDAKQRVTKAMSGNYSYNATKVLDSSHTIVFCTRTDIDEQFLHQLLESDDQNGRFKDEKAKQGQADTRSGYVNFYRNEKKDLFGWMENQTFIALGQLLLSAGIEGVDATAMGGFDEDILNAEFNLTEKGYRASVVVCLGYHSESDFNAKLPKSRLSKDIIFTRL